VDVPVVWVVVGVVVLWVHKRVIGDHVASAGCTPRLAVEAWTQRREVMRVRVRVRVWVSADGMVLVMGAAAGVSQLAASQLATLPRPKVTVRS
jgi:hypothetical protein